MASWHDLSGHVALVTGGNSGIGKGMARGLHDAGAAVAIWGTNTDRNAAAVEELSADGGAPVAAFTVDVADEEAVAAGVAATLERFGQIDSCFANAGVPGRPTPIDEMSTAEWRRVTSVNLDGQFFTVRAVVGHMKTRRTGSIVFTSSVSQSDGLPYSPHYAAAKAGVAAMALAMALLHIFVLGGDPARAAGCVLALAPLVRMVDAAPHWRHERQHRHRARDGADPRLHPFVDAHGRQFLGRSHPCHPLPAAADLYRLCDLPDRQRRAADLRGHDRRDHA